MNLNPEWWKEEGYSSATDWLLNMPEEERKELQEEWKKASEIVAQVIEESK